MKRFTMITIAVSFAALTACNKMQNAAKPSLSSDDDKTVYAIGVDMGSKLKTLQLSSNEMNILKMGIDEGAAGTEPKVDMKTQIMKVGDLLRTRAQKFAEKEKEAASTFLANAEKAKGATKTETGLIFVETEAGSGDSPTPADRVKVNYHGTLRDGTVFDSTRERGQPATFRLDRVIKCWTEGVQKMKAGGKAELYCPAEIAYGDRGAPPKIPPGAALKFEVELLEVVKGDTPQAAKPSDKAKKTN
ncbi:MAG: FKBP-type peptidyl-prolyl cis-trans isomerase [Bdellovibrionales bacterium]|nr:FKBP-type peptidyl-prolyl cis-trans isomerase [Bdellovibrionales bacterium]